LNWERRFEDLLRDANEILEPALGLHLESAGARLWQPATAENELGALLDELAQHDRGHDVDWVVGFVKSTPELVFDHHQLGVGRLLSKYLVMRASNDPRELELLSHQYYSLSDEEKAELHTERKRHRWLAVFLHELGHTLGARHRLEAGSIMHPTYNPDESGFDEPTLSLLRITVGANLGSPSAETYRAVHAYYEAHPDGWVPSERQETLTWLASYARPGSEAATVAPTPAQTPAQTPAPTPAPAPTSAAVPATAAEPAATTPLPLSTLTKSDRARYDAALRAEANGQFGEALRTLLPIVETHARVLKVQELRCRLAKRQNFFASVEEAHCEPAIALQGGAAR
jgi:hypothetical protein